MDTHTSKFKIRLGLFVAGGLALFMLAIFIIGKQKNLFDPVFKITTNFYNVSGLQVGNNIRFSGINVGTVDNITIINDSTVRVDMLVRKPVQQFMKADCVVAIGSEGLIGDRLLVISQGSADSPLARDGEHLKSVEPVETDAIISSLKVTSGHIEIVTKELSEIMLKVNSGRGTLGRLIHDSLIARNIDQTIANFQNTSNELDEMVMATKGNVSSIMESFQQTADNAEGSTRQLEGIMIKVNSGQGTLGRLIHDTITSNNIDQTILNLKNSSKGLDENMEALKHNIFFRGYYKKKAKEEERKRLEDAAKELP